jgi:hypothetical protein
MIGALIGTAIGLIVILIFALLKRYDKSILYGLTLAAIGFLYVGFVWTDITQEITNIPQAIFFLFLAYWGIKKNFNFLIAGYFLHGIWDITYGLHADSSLIPPQYDWFCFTIDFMIGFYLIIIKNRLKPNPAELS